MAGRWDGEKIKRWRAARGLSVRALGRELRASKSAVSRWERGESPPPEQIGLLLAGLGLRLADRKRLRARRAREREARDGERRAERERARAEQVRRGERDQREQDGSPAQWW